MEDAGLHLLYITKYTLIERGDSVGKVIGADSLRRLSSYRDAIGHVYPALADQVSLCCISFPFPLCIGHFSIKHPFMWHSLFSNHSFQAPQMLPSLQLMDWFHSHHYILPTTNTQ